MRIPPEKIPSDYLAEGRYEQARLLNPELADNYVAHSLIGDPEADAVIEELAPLGQRELGRLVQAGMERDEDALRDAPPLLREFFHRPGDPSRLGQ